MAVIKFTNDHIRINAHYTVKSIDLSLDGASALEQGKTTKKALKGDSTQATVTYTDGDKVTWLAKGDFSFDKDETVTITGGGRDQDELVATDGHGRKGVWVPK